MPCEVAPSAIAAASSGELRRQSRPTTMLDAPLHAANAAPMSRTRSASRSSGTTPRVVRLEDAVEIAGHARMLRADAGASGVGVEGCPAKPRASLLDDEPITDASGTSSPSRYHHFASQ